LPVHTEKEKLSQTQRRRSDTHLGKHRRGERESKRRRAREEGERGTERKKTN
jgi:hypothetical protein